MAMITPFPTPHLDDGCREENIVPLIKSSSLFRRIEKRDSKILREVWKMPFFKWSEMKADFITPGYSRAHGPAIKGEKIEVALIHYPAGTVAKPHTHPNEQVQVVMKGKARYRLGKDEKVLGPGEAVLIPANTEHEVEILEDMEVINCKDAVAGWSVYHARWEK
jgi:quercetin dioxygenase-like cupin family protein